MTVGGQCQVCSGRVETYRHDWLSRCEQCRVLIADLPVAIPTVPDDAGLDEALRFSGLEPLRLANNRRLVDVFARLAPAGARLLDVGCGPGMLLSQARLSGYRVEGVEPDANIVSVARDAQVEVRHGYFPEALAPDETFDIIVFNDVLEHIPDLRGALEASARHMAPGGVLCLNCPDQRGFYFRVAAVLDRLGVHGPYDRLWQRGMPSPHVWYFTPALLKRAAEAAGFQHVEDTRLATIELRGLWDRIRYVDDTPRLLSLATFVFAVVTYPILALVPSDATACFFRRR